MKGLAFALSVILLLAVLVTANSIVLCKRLDAITAAIEPVGVDAGRFECIYQEFDGLSGMIMLTVRDDIRLSIVNAFGDCISYAGVGDEKELAAAKSRLLHTIAEVRRLSSFSLDAIF